MNWHICPKCNGWERVDDCRGKPAPVNPHPGTIPSFDNRWHGGARKLLRAVAEVVDDKILSSLLKSDVVGIAGSSDLLGVKIAFFTADETKAHALNRYVPAIKCALADLYRPIHPVPITEFEVIAHV
jgi:hypothetical protein